MTIGDRIKAARKLRGVSYEELAKKTKIPADVLMYIEENNYSLYPQTIVLFCDTLNVSADYLLGRVDEKMDRVIQAIKGLEPYQFEYIEEMLKEMPRPEKEGDYG